MNRNISIFMSQRTPAQATDPLDVQWYAYTQWVEARPNETIGDRAHFEHEAVMWLPLPDDLPTAEALQLLSLVHRLAVNDHVRDGLWETSMAAMRHADAQVADRRQRLIDFFAKDTLTSDMAATAINVVDDRITDELAALHDRLHGDGTPQDGDEARAHLWGRMARIVSALK